MQIDELFLDKGDEPFTITLGFDDADFIQEIRVSMRYARNAALKLDVRVKSREALDAVAGTRSKSPRLAAVLAGKEPIDWRRATSPTSFDMRLRPPRWAPRR